MEKRFNFLQLVLFAACFGIDRVAKMNLDWFISLNSFAVFSFAPHSNPGFILQSFSTQSALSRVVFVCSLYGFLFFGFFALQTFLPPGLKMLRLGATLFFAAVSGNCFDRAFNGAVSDFIGVGPEASRIYFNFADVFMWIGFASILFSLFKFEHQIWHPNSKRRGFLVDFRYQFRAALQTALVAMSATLILILFSYTFFAHVRGFVANDLVFEYVLSAGALGLFFSGITFVTSLMLSHRSAGAVHAFENYVEALLKGEKRASFALRTGDEHKRLTALAEKIKIELETLKGESI